jgi:hypothetical protein
LDPAKVSARPADSTPAPAGNKTRWALLGASLLALAFSWWLLATWKASINLDTAMYLSGAMTLLDGGLLYVDFVDLNPPLTVPLHIPAILLTAYLQLDAIGAYYWLLFAASFCSALATYKLLTGDSPDRRWRAVLVSLAPLLLLFTQDIYTEMGQRSHLFVLAALPFIIVRMRSARGEPAGLLIAIATGLFIGLTASLKPFHYGAILAAAEAYLLVRHRNLTALLAPEIGAAVCVVAGYGLFILNLPEASTDAFFNFLLPLTVQSYSAYGLELPALMQHAARHLTWPLILGAAAYFLNRSDVDPRYRELADIAAVTGLTAVGVYLIQAKGWPYHATSVVMSAYILLAILLSRFSAGLAVSRAGRILAAAPLLTLFAFFAAGATQATMRAIRVGFWELKTDDAALILNATQPDDTVLVVSTGVDASYPLLLLTERRPGTRYAFMFPLPMLYANAEPDAGSIYGYSIPAELAGDEQHFLATLNQDIDERDPALILIDHMTPCFACPADMNLPAYLVGHLNELPGLRNYVPIAETERFTALLKAPRDSSGNDLQ